MDTSIAALIAAPCATFCSTVLRGFQNKAVACNNKRQAFTVGTIMNACDVLVIASIAHHASLTIIVLSALGAGIGWITGMRIHDRLNYKRRQLLKQQKKEKQKRKVLKVVQKVLAKKDLEQVPS